MTDSYHFQTLNRGEMEVCADGGVRWCGYYSGDRHSLTAAEVRGRGFDSAEEFANRASSLNSYKIIRAAIGPFGSGATLKTSGDKIVGRVEAELSECASAAVDPLSAVIARLAASIDADLLKLLSPAPEPKRAPLPHFNQRTEFDPFPDYVVFHEFEPVAPLYDSPTTDSAYPAIAGLLRVSDGGPANASASLLLKTA